MKKFVPLFMIITLVFFFAGTQVSAQASNDKDSVLKVKVFFHCANGKKLLETRLAEVDGVVDVDADLETKVLSIKHKTAVITKEGLVEAIEKIGYLTEFSDPNKKIKKACSHGEEGHDHDHDH